jgi:co-chaperonin GroES (HSP10)
MSAVISQMKASHAEDPRKEIWDKIGSVADYTLYHNRILVAVYIRPSKIKTASGFELELPESVRKEDEFQGKVGLVLKVGPSAFLDDEHNKFHGQQVEVGDWIVFKPSDSWAAKIKGVLCRHIEDSLVVARIPSPDYVY